MQEISTTLITLGALMMLGLVLLGVPVKIALLFAGIAAATDPAATADVVHETGAEGPFSQTLIGIVAVDDAWGLIAFSLILAAVLLINCDGGMANVALASLREIGGAVVLGTVLGIPMAYLSGRVSDGEPLQAEALGMVFLCGGLALWLDVSFILAAIVMGVVVTNLARHHKRPFHAIEGIEIGATVTFEVIGPVLTRVALHRVGETATITDSGNGDH
jgi:NhaP-type Na+/H+ or K+/H+ antiporter